MQKTVIIIPCYNEAERLPLDEFKKGFVLNPDVLFLFANDGSTDNTIEILNHLALEFGNVNLLDIQPNTGKANAVRYAIQHALENYSFDYIGYFDADLATPLSEIHRFIDYFEDDLKRKMVVGSRVRRMGAEIDRTWKRHIIGRVFATFASATLRLPIYDTQCGAKMIRQDVVELLFKEPFISKWLFDVEVFARLTLHIGYPEIKSAVFEHPLGKWIEKGDSRIKPKDFFRFPLDLFKIYRKYSSKIKKIKQSK